MERAEQWMNRRDGGILTWDKLSRIEDSRERKRTHTTEDARRNRDDETGSEKKKTTEYLKPDGSLGNDGVFVCGQI